MIKKHIKNIFTVFFKKALKKVLLEKLENNKYTLQSIKTQRDNKEVTEWEYYKFTWKIEGRIDMLQYIINNL